MAGQSIAQRSTLTVNHGKYYVDTTVSETTQRGGFADKLINVFMGGHTFYTFLLYAKPKPDDQNGAPATKQTYQMYVGPKKDFNVDTDVMAVRAHAELAPVTFEEVTWPSNWKKPEYTPLPDGYGILEVTMDMNFDDFKTNYNKVAEEKCQPRSFCSWSGSTCGCALSESDSLYDQCKAVCSQWTKKDVDCPDGGCYGFGVKFPEKFEAKDQKVQHDPTCYPKNEDWNIEFQKADETKAGSCYYKDLPKAQFCTTF